MKKRDKNKKIKRHWERVEEVGKKKYKHRIV